MRLLRRYWAKAIGRYPFADRPIPAEDIERARALAIDRQWSKRALAIQAGAEDPAKPPIGETSLDAKP